MFIFLFLEKNRSFFNRVFGKINYIENNIIFCQLDYPVKFFLYFIEKVTNVLSSLILFCSEYRSLKQSHKKLIS